MVYIYLYQAEMDTGKDLEDLKQKFKNKNTDVENLDSIFREANSFTEELEQNTRQYIVEDSNDTEELTRILNKQKQHQDRRRRDGR